MCVLTNKGFSNTQHLEGGKTTLIVTGTIPVGNMVDTLRTEEGVSPCPLLPTPS